MYPEDCVQSLIQPSDWWINNTDKILCRSVWSGRPCRATSTRTAETRVMHQCFARAPIVCHPLNDSLHNGEMGLDCGRFYVQRLLFGPMFNSQSLPYPKRSA